MNKLIEVIKRYGDIELLVAEMEVCNSEFEVETFDELAEFLEMELTYAD